MTTFVELVRAELVAAAAVTALVGQRIYPKRAPQGTAAPYVVLSVVSESPSASFVDTQEDRLRQARVQVDCYATKYLDAHAVAQAVDKVVADLARPDLSATRLQERDLWDDEAQLHNASADFLVSS